MTGYKKKSSSSSSSSSSKKFTCPTCGYVTFLKARFTKHVKYHSMPFMKCEFCDFKSQYSWNLDRHMKNHNTLGEISCPLCNFSCDMKQSLTSHLQNHHTNVPEDIMAQYRGCSSSSNTKNKSPGGSRRESCAEEEDGPSSYDPEEEEEHEEEQAIPLINSSSGSGINKIQQTDNDDTRKVLTKKFYKCRYCTFNALSELGLNKHVMQAHHDGSSGTNCKTVNSASAASSAMVVNKPMPNLIPIPKNHSINNNTKPSTSQDYSESHTDLDATTHPTKKIEFLRNLGLSPSRDSRENTSSSNTPVQKRRKTIFQRRTSFFDKLSKKLTSSPVLSQSATVKSSISNLNNTTSSTRCQYCRHRCKTSADLMQHLRQCKEVSSRNSSSNFLPDEDSYDSLIIRENERSSQNQNQKDPHFVWKVEPPEEYEEEEESSSTQYFHNFDGFSGLQVDTTNNEYDDHHDHDPLAISPAPTDALSSTESTGSAQHVTKSRKVYRCPQSDCEFWATTASRFHVHIVGHYNTKPFECSQCSYRSNWRWDITKHIRLKTMRDPSHTKARVLLTDKSGERNYRKYDRYLVPMELSYNADSKLPDCSTVASKRPDVELIPCPSPSPAASTSSNRSVSPTIIPSKMPKLTKAPNNPTTTTLSRENFHLRQALTGPTLLKMMEDPLKPVITVSPIKSPKEQQTGKTFVERNIMAGCEIFVQNNPNSLLKSSQQPHPQQPAPLFLCEECPARFLYEKELRIHHTFHEKRSQFYCGFCSYSARQEFPHLMTHRKVHTDQYQQKTESLLEDGKFVIAPKLRFDCCSGGNKQKSRDQQETFIPPVTITPSSFRHLEDEGDDDNNNDDNLSSSDPASLSCPNCPARFSSIASFLQHAHNHGRRTPYMCQFCDFGADSRNNLTLHSVLHFGSEITIEPEVELKEDDNDEPIDVEDMFIPTVILPEEDDQEGQKNRNNRNDESSFINANAYQGNPEFNYPTYVKNGRIKSKRYKCLKCPSAFEKRDQYRVHMGLHGSNQRYKCMVCDYSVTYYANFIQHLKKHENQPNVSKEQLVATPLSKMRKDNNNAMLTLQNSRMEKKVPPLVLKVPNAR